MFTLYKKLWGRRGRRAHYSKVILIHKVNRFVYLFKFISNRNIEGTFYTFGVVDNFMHLKLFEFIYCVIVSDLFCATCWIKHL